MRLIGLTGIKTLAGKGVCLQTKLIAADLVMLVGHRSRRGRLESHCDVEAITGPDHECHSELTEWYNAGLDSNARDMQAHRSGSASSQRPGRAQQVACRNHAVRSCFSRPALLRSIAAVDHKLRASHELRFVRGHMLPNVRWYAILAAWFAVTVKMCTLRKQIGPCATRRKAVRCTPDR